MKGVWHDYSGIQSPNSVRRIADWRDDADRPLS